MRPPTVRATVLAEAASLMDEATLDVIDKAEDDIEQGRVHNWPDVRASLEKKFLGK